MEQKPARLYYKSNPLINRKKTRVKILNMVFNINRTLYVKFVTPEKREKYQFYEFRYYFIDDLMKFRGQKTNGKMDISQKQHYICFFFIIHPSKQYTQFIDIDF